MREALRIGLFVGIIALSAEAVAAYEWAETGPVGDRSGMQSLVVDPDDPQIVWVGGGSRVWVTDDGGDSWSQVLQVIPPSLIERPVADDDEDDEDDDDEDDDDDDDEFDDDEFDDDEFDDDEFDDDDEAAADEEDDDDDDDDDSISAEPIDDQTRSDAADMLDEDEMLRRAAGPRRLRVIGDRLYVCTDLGLYVVDRAARTLGTDRAIKFGRDVPVIDVAPALNGGVLLATPGGLREMGDFEHATPVPGPLGARPIAALLNHRGRVLAATFDGLWADSGSGFGRLGVPNTHRMVLDIIAMAGDRYAVATGGEVLFLSIPLDGPPEEQMRWGMQGAERLAIDRTGVVWAVGPRGVWRYDGELWRLAYEGLSSRQLADIASGRTDEVQVWVVGRGGAWKRVPEHARVLHDRARKVARTVIDGAPPLWDVLQAAYRAREVDHGAVEAARITQSLAWALPSVELRLTHIEARDEDLALPPEFEAPIIVQADITPREDEVRLTAHWNLFPVFWAMTDTASPYGGTSLGAEGVRRTAEREKVREAVAAAYSTWIDKRVDLAIRQPASAVEAVKLRLAVEKLEAELSSLTGGWFVAPLPLTAAPASTRAPSNPPDGARASLVQASPRVGEAR